VDIGGIVTGALDQIHALWPEGDPGKLRTAAAAYDDWAVAVHDCAGVCGQKASDVLDSVKGVAADNFASYHAPVGTGLHELGDLATDLARRCREYADAIVEAHHGLWGVIIDLGVMLAVTTAISVVSFGAAAPFAEADAIIRAGKLVDKAAKIGMTLSATAARLAASASYGMSTVATIGLIQIPVVRGVKAAAGIDQPSLGHDALLVGAETVLGGIGGAARSTVAIRSLAKEGAKRGWGAPALHPTHIEGRLVRRVPGDVSYDELVTELDRSTYATARRHGLTVTEKGERFVHIGGPYHVPFTKGYGDPVLTTRRWDWPSIPSAFKEDWENLYDLAGRYGVTRHTFRDRWGPRTIFTQDDPEATRRIMNILRGHEPDAPGPGGSGGPTPPEEA
jgi:hypothetical protein